MNIYKNRKGITIIEIMIAAGIMGAMAIGGMRLLNTQQKSQKKIEYNYDAREATNLLESILSDGGNCTTLFNTKSVSASDINSALSSTGIIYTIKTPNSNPPVYTIDPSKTAYSVGVAMPQPLIISRLQLAAGNIEGIDIAKSIDSDDVVVRFNLEVRYTKALRQGSNRTAVSAKNTVGGTDTKVYGIPIIAKLDGVYNGGSGPGKIVSCTTGAGAFEGLWHMTSTGINFSGASSGNRVSIGTGGPEGEDAEDRSVLHIKDENSLIYLEDTTGGSGVNNKSFWANGEFSTAFGKNIDPYSGTGADFDLFDSAKPAWWLAFDNTLGAEDQFRIERQEGTERKQHFTINKDGKVGIGTKLPMFKLDIFADISADNTNAVVRLLRSDISNESLLVYATGPEGAPNTDNKWCTGLTNSSTTIEDHWSLFKDCLFGAGGATTMLTVDPEGDVGIGVIDPEYILDIKGRLGATDIAVRIMEGGLQLTDGKITLSGGTEGNLIMTGGEIVTAGGDISTGGGNILTAGGNLNLASGTGTAQRFTGTSDFRLKKEIDDIESGLELIRDIRGVSFKWKKNSEKSFGVIAQELERSLPQLVFTGKDGIKSVDYNALVAPLIEAVKEQQDIIENQSRRMDRLEEMLQRVLKHQR